MLVTTRPSPLRVGINQDPEISINADSRKIFDTVTSSSVSPYEKDPERPPSWNNRNRRRFGFDGLPIIASSGDSKSAMNTENIASVYKNGFVEGIIRAFNQDLHLVIRPDDVWQAILSQFSLFVKGNAEHLRRMFVSHDGKKNLTLDFTTKSLCQLDFSEVALDFASAIQDNVVDAELREWMIPDFSTTTNHDKAVAAFSMMGAMQEYFRLAVMVGCGLPSVTLLGARDDWEMLASRVGKLKEYGEECQHWASLLHPIIHYMIRTFDEPDSQDVKDFWLRVAWETGHTMGSADGRILSGWITAFAYFQQNGEVTRDYNESSFSAHGQLQDRRRLILEGVSYPLIRPGDIPSSLVLVPVTIIDLEADVLRFSTAISGTVGMSISDGNTAQPFSAWWVVQECEEPIYSSQRALLLKESHTST